MKIINEIQLDFQDVLIRPKRSTLRSRADVDLEREFKFPHSKKVWKGIPIIASNMSTVGTVPIYDILNNNKMMTCLHKFNTYEDIKDIQGNNYMLSTGIKDNDWNRLTNILKHIEPEFICVDVPNGYCDHITDFTRKIREFVPDVVIAAGNVVTREMVEEYTLNGSVDIIKCGIGSGSACTTRLKTGVGYPQLSSVLECADAAHGCDAHIISDGGIVNVGDIGKAFGAGADFCMMGSMFAGHDECPGDVIEENGKKYKMFYGMSSDTAMNKFYNGVAKYRTSEGRTVKIALKGPIQNTIDDILGGLRSTCTYVGAKTLKDLPKCTTFLKVNHQLNTHLI